MKLLRILFWSLIAALLVIDAAGQSVPANKVLAGPTSGAAAPAKYRALVAGDIPALPWSTIDAGGTATYVWTANGVGVAPTWQAVAASGGTWGTITGTLSSQTDLQSALDAKQVTGLSYLLASGGTLSGPNTITATTTNWIKFKFDALGGSLPTPATATPTTFTLANETAAINGTQQNAPSFIQRGYGWGTSGGTSQPVDVYYLHQPIQGTTPGIFWGVRYSVNGGAFTNILSFNSSGVPALTIPSATTIGAALTVSSGGAAITGSSSVVGSFTQTVTSIGTTTTNSYLLTNTTAATVGAQQYSPAFTMRGNGWKTDATAGSQTVDFVQQVISVQGAAAPTGSWTLYSSINASAVAIAAQVSSAGDLSLGTVSAGGGIARVHTITGHSSSTLNINAGSGTGTLRAASTTVATYTAALFAVTGKLTTTGSGTVAGLNVGSLGSDPSALVDGDFWYTTGNGPTVRVGGSTQYLARTTGINSGLIIYGGAANNGFVTATAGFSFASGSLSIPNNVTLTAGYLIETADISPAQITGNQNDYSPSGLSTAAVLRLSTDASRNITSITGGTDGRNLTIYNVGAQNIVFTADDGSSGTAANRFVTVKTLLPGEACEIKYDGTTSRWRHVN